MKTLFTFLLPFVMMCGTAWLFADEPTVAELEQIRRNERRTQYLLENKDQTTTVTGWATLPDGKPAVGFKVGAWGRSILQIGLGDPYVQVTTDENGRFSMTVLLQYCYWFDITDPNKTYTAYDRHVELKEPLAPDTIRFQLQKGIPVEGVVIDSDKNEPIAGLEILLLHEPVHTKELGGEARFAHEKKQQLLREATTDQQGRFKFPALPNEKYMVSFDSIHDSEPPTDTVAALYTRTFTSGKEPIRLEFKIPTPWRGRLLQKDGTPAAFFPVEFEIPFDFGTAYNRLITDKDGCFQYYRPVQVRSLSVHTLEQNQWLYWNSTGKELPLDAVFQLSTPLTAKGQLVRKSTGKPLGNFKFACQSRYQTDTVTTDENGNFELTQLHLANKANLCFLNEPDDLDTCALYETFHHFTPTELDKVVELGVLELEESGWLDPNSLQNLPGKEIVIDGTTLDGKVFDWKKYAGKVVLIDFWATWCGPCLEEVPRLKTLYEKYHGKGFEIVGISVDEGEDLTVLKKALEKHQFPWMILADEKRDEAGQMTMTSRFAISTVPRCILVGRDGKVISVEARGEKLEEELQRLFP